MDDVLVPIVPPTAAATYAYQLKQTELKANWKVSPMDRQTSCVGRTRPLTLLKAKWQIGIVLKK